MEKILVLDFGCKYNQSVARSVRELSVYSEIKPCTASLEGIQKGGYKGVAVIGGTEEIPPDTEYIKSVLALDVPVIGVGCTTGIMALLPSGMVHISGLEQLQSESGTAKMKSFLFTACGCAGDWKIESFIDHTVAGLRKKIGDKKVLLALSGGVDSSVCALLMHRAIGKQLTCIFVDHGLMRKNEPQEVVNTFGSGFGINLIHVDASERFLSRLAGVTDPESKRKIIGEEFIRVFEDEAKKIGKVDFLVQGTIYPDIIESGVGDSKLVKSHHNVGGLPDHVDFEEIVEPLRDLFKDEVRKTGQALGLPEVLYNRQPFPGPGLGVRVIGEITREKLDTLRDADAIFREEVAAAGLDTRLGQYFAILTSMRSVGVKSDARTYDYTVGLRAVNTSDFMTADFAKIPYEVLGKASMRITSEVSGVGRVVYDITSKPPATIEWE